MVEFRRQRQRIRCKPGCVWIILIAYWALQVLAGVRLLFTGLIPLEQQPETHALWRMARAFGAECAQAPDERITHVVAKARGTEKVLWALRRGVHVVSKAWCAAFPPNPHLSQGFLSCGPGFYRGAVQGVGVLIRV